MDSRVRKFTLRKHAYSNILKILQPKTENFQLKKKSVIFHISAQNIVCAYSLQPPRRDGNSEDDPRPGRPTDVISQEMIDRVERPVLNNRRIKFVELASECGVSNGSVYTIIHEHLGMSKVSARWVHWNLNMQDRQQRVESSQELLEVYNANPEDFHTHLVKGDETWLHHWDPDTKKESMQWKHPGSPPL